MRDPLGSRLIRTVRYGVPSDATAYARKRNGGTRFCYHYSF